MLKEVVDKAFVALSPLHGARLTNYTGPHGKWQT